MDTKTENHWRILQTNLEMSRYADAKATAVLSICGILVTLALSRVDKMFSVPGHSALLIIMVLVPGILVMTSVFFAFRSIHPRIIPQQKPSILFFGSIAQKFKNAEHYYQTLQEEMDSEHGIRDDLAEQIYINASLAQRKFHDVTYSIRYFALTIVVLVIECCVYLIYQIGS